MVKAKLVPRIRIQLSKWMLIKRIMNKKTLISKIKDKIIIQFQYLRMKSNTNLCNLIRTVKVNMRLQSQNLLKHTPVLLYQRFRFNL